MSAFQVSESVLATAAAVATAVTAIWTLVRVGTESRATTRPYVLAELDPMLRKPYQYLVIRNAGRSEARSVCVRFTPSLPGLTRADAPTSTTPFLVARYAQEIPLLAPGQSLRNIWFAGDPGAETQSNTEPLPEQFEVELKYTDAGQSRWRRQPRKYVGRYLLDVDLARNETFVTSSDDPQELLKRMTKSLESICRRLGSLHVISETREARERRRADERNAGRVQDRASAQRLVPDADQPE